MSKTRVNALVSRVRWERHGGCRIVPVMPEWRAYPSAFSNGVNSLPDTFIDGPESIGTPGDAPATDVTAENSIFSLLKGALVALGVSTGSGDGDTNDNGKVYADLPATLGNPDDTAQTDFTASASAIALTKGVLARAGL